MFLPETNRLAIESEDGAMRSRIRLIPFQFRIEEGARTLRVGNFFARVGIGKCREAAEFPPSTFGYFPAERRVMVGKKLKRRRCVPFLSHEQHRRVRSEQEKS